MGGFGDIGRLEVAGVEAFAKDDAGMGAEFPIHLVGADVEGVDEAGAALEEAIGEAAGGGADVEADFIVDVDFPVVEGSFDFQATAADEAGLGEELHFCIFGDFAAGFVGLLAIEENLAGEDEGFRFFA